MSYLKLTITYIQAMMHSIYVSWVGSNNHTFLSLYGLDPGHGPSDTGVMKMGNIAPRVGFKPTLIVCPELVF